MFGRIFKTILSLVFSIIFCQKSIAQPTLPDLVSVTENGINIVTWKSPYDVVKSIAVLRSDDSINNYKTIGYVKNTKKGTQAYIDGHPLVGKNYYKLVLAFNSDLTWETNVTSVVVDSASLAKAKVLPPNDSLQKFIDIEKSSVVIPGKAENGGGLVVEVPNIQDINAHTYIRSKYVFTNPFTGHVNIEIPETEMANTQIIFYNNKAKRIFDIPKILKPIMIVDKRNFQSKGIFKFEILESGKVKESGYITIY